MFTGGNATIMVRDFERAIHFYTEVLGLDLLYRAGDEWAEVRTDGLTLGLHLWRGHGPAPGAASGISIGLGVRSIEPAIAELKQRGIEFRGQVQDNDNVKLAFFGDPDGNPLYLCEVKPAPAHS
ncbi:MAG TPA: VOC family protein [Candidatus Udaeobacter sp.]|nr:VOC family protein [Candidatus Udaeobacter sp.]